MVTDVAPAPEATGTASTRELSYRDALREAITQEIRKELAVDEMAKRFDVDISDAKSIADKQRKVAAKLAPSIKLDGKSDEYVASLIDFSVMAREEQTAASP